MSIPFIYRTQTVSAAKAEAEKIRLIGEAEAHALEAIGISEAERMRMKATVYKKYGDAAILNITLNALPKVNDALCITFTYCSINAYVSIIVIMFFSLFRSQPKSQHR